MIVIKSDRRYKFFQQGYTTIAQFGWGNLAEKKLFDDLLGSLRETYGPEFSDIVPNGSSWSRRVRNENYAVEQNRNAKRRRIYLKKESDITIALLKS